MMSKKIIPLGQSLIVLVGPSGSGKSTFALSNFPPQRVVSTDQLRWEVTEDFKRQDKNDVVFPEFEHRLLWQLANGGRVVADATHIKDADRRRTAQIGKSLNVPVIYVVIDRPLEDKLKTGGWRLEVVKKGLNLVEQHNQTFRANEKKILDGDKIADLVIDTRVDEYEVVNALPRDHYDVVPFLESKGFASLRVIGDIHGNVEGLDKAIEDAEEEKRFLLFLGDIVDYDPRGIEALETVHNLITTGRAAMVRGNHEKKIWRIIEQIFLGGGTFSGQISHGNEVTISRLKAMNNTQRERWIRKFQTVVELSPDWIQIGEDWIFAHGAATPRMWDETLFRAHKNSKEESFAMYGETTGEFEGGYPVRIYDWVEKIPPGKNAMVGHAVLSTEKPVIKRGAEKQRAFMLDTGSSKEIDGVKGHLSWADFEFFQERKLIIKGLGGE
jgi:predicted kinase